MAKGEFEEEEVEEMRGTLVHEGWQVLDRKYICKDLISLGSNSYFKFTNFVG